MKHAIPVRASIILAITAVAVTAAWGQVHVLTQHNDSRRSGANLQEKTLTVAAVKQKFGKLWTLFADGQIVAQPLYVSGLKVARRGTFNAVIVSTMHNTILDKSCNAAARCDLDLGSAGPLLVRGTAPDSDLLIGGGKDGNIYVVDPANMGHFTSPTGPVAMDCANPNVVQTIPKNFYVAVYGLKP